MIFITSLFVLSISALSALLPEPALFIRPYLLLIGVWTIVAINRPHLGMKHLLLIGSCVFFAAITLMLNAKLALDPRMGALPIATFLLLLTTLHASQLNPPNQPKQMTLIVAGLFLTILTGILIRPALAELSYLQAAYLSHSQPLQLTLEQLNNAVKQNPQLGRYHRSLARAHLKAAYVLATSEDPSTAPLLSEHIQAAINQAHQTVRYEHGAADSWAELGQTYLQLIGPIPDAHLWAQASLERAIKLDPTNADYPLALAQVYIRSNQAALAKSLLTDLLSRFPTDPRPAFLLATLLRETDPTQASNYYRLALEHARTEDVPLIKQQMQTTSP